jgi:hypothetical protein
MWNSGDLSVLVKYIHFSKECSFAPLLQSMCCGRMLGRRKKCTKFVLHSLTNEQMQHRVTASEVCVQNSQNNPHYLIAFLLKTSTIVRWDVKAWNGEKIIAKAQKWIAFKSQGSQQSWSHSLINIVLISREFVAGRTSMGQWILTVCAENVTEAHFTRLSVVFAQQWYCSFWLPLNS